MICVATFFSHFGAMQYKKTCDRTGIPARMMPVPRMLSSSCGTCVRVETDAPDHLPRTEETEQLALALSDGSYSVFWRAENS